MGKKFVSCANFSRRHRPSLRLIVQGGVRYSLGEQARSVCRKARRKHAKLAPKTMMRNAKDGPLAHGDCPGSPKTNAIDNRK